MSSKVASALLTVVFIAQCQVVVGAQTATQVASGNQVNPAETGANTMQFPKQILRTGIRLDSASIAPNSMQLADDIQLTSVLERIQTLKSKVQSLSACPEKSDARLDLLEAKEQASEIIDKTSLEIEFAIAEMNAEQNVYNEIMSSFTSDRDKLVARTNAVSYTTNGALWAICESFTIPSWARPKYAISSGITGILAGIIPSVASAYTLKAVNGKKKTSEVEPNMLAKLFNYPVTADIEYPDAVWKFLNQPPADQPKGKTRRDQLIDRWVADSNIPGFTNRESKSQLDALTGSVSQRKGLSIATLGTRLVMLQQLSSEVLKMKRMLLELAMVVEGDKQFVATQSSGTPISTRFSEPLR